MLREETDDHAAQGSILTVLADHCRALRHCRRCAMGMESPKLTACNYLMRA